VELVSTVEVGNHCAWAPWKASDVETGTLDIATQICFNTQPSAMSTLACGLRSGNVILVDVTEKLLLAPPGSPAGRTIQAYPAISPHSGICPRPRQR